MSEWNRRLICLDVGTKFWKVWPAHERESFSLWERIKAFNDPALAARPYQLQEKELRAIIERLRHRYE